MRTASAASSGVLAGLRSTRPANTRVWMTSSGWPFTNVSSERKVSSEGPSMSCSSPMLPPGKRSEAAGVFAKASPWSTMAIQLPKL